MRLVNNTDAYAAAFGEEEAIRILARTGFDAIDWSFFEMTQDDNPWCQPDFRDRARKMKAIAEECGIGFSQAHAPFATSKGEEPFDTLRMQRILDSIEASAIMGIRNIIVHPKQHLPYAKNKNLLFDMNVEMYKSLVPVCEKFGIHVCVENMWQFDNNRQVIIDSVCAQPEEFCAMIDAVDSPWIVGCLDIGHAALVGVDPADIIRALGKDRLKCLHVHDVDYRRDCHTLPFLEKLDWESITQALADIDYQEDFTYECASFPFRFPAELREDACKFMERTGRYLISRIDAKRA